MKQSKILNYSLIVICIIIILLGLFYLYQYLNKSTEHFAISNLTSILNQNYYKGEPIIKTINNAGTVDIDIQTVTKTTPCEYIASNNIGLYGTDNKNLYYFNKTDNKWYITPIKPILPSITNPDFNNTKTNCSFKKNLFASKSTLWYYYDTLNEMVRVDCLYYINLDANGNPSINTTTNNKVVDLNCLRLPLLNTSTTTTPATTSSQPTTYADKPYLTFNRIRLFAANDNILFAVGCEPLNVPTTIYYCKLNNGKPTSNDSSIWKTIDIPFDRKNIKNILINDSCVFIYYNELSTNNIIINKIYYNIIEFNSDNTIKSTWVEWSIPITDVNTPFYDKGNNYIMYVNNDIIYINDLYMKKLWWHCLENNKPVEKDNYKWYMLTFSNNLNILDMTIYNNNLIGYNNIQNSKFYVINLYNTSTVPTSTAPTAMSPTSIVVNMLLTLFNIIIPLVITTTVVVPVPTGSGTPTTTISSGSSSGSATSTTTGSGTPTTTSYIESGSGTPTTTSYIESETESESETPTTTYTGYSSSSGSSSGSISGSSSSSGSGAGSSSGSGAGSGSGSGAGSGTSSGSGSGTSSGSGSGTSSGIPTTTKYIPTITANLNIKDKIGVGMVLDGSNNVGNLNDFISKNSILGNNIYISPMNSTGLNPDNKDNYFTTTSTKSKNIESSFYPMIHLE